MIVKRLSLIFLIFGGLAFFTRSDFFTIKSINCKTQYGPCNARDEEALNEFKGRNLFFLSSNSINQKLGKDFLNRRMVVEKIFPGSLVVVLEKRKPSIAIQLESNPSGVFLADKDGKIISFEKDSSLPKLVIKFNPGLVIGESLPPGVVRAISIITLVNKNQKISRVLLEENLEISLAEGPQVLFPLDKDPQILVGALQLILTRSKIDGSLPKVIDLRYSNPVLKY